ncbi:hypothetical protein [Bradyrhizobium sp. S69]|uniref:hypothetical protein n=1 Tax=Bradyrhizobium sp. S69 TaxID=1641856 RepID=UPI00131E7D76|nr:hypothetical protein [Bradyrhizobium sp. S69]
MTPANDNDQPIAADRVIEVRPRPDELNRILHLRFPGMGPAYGAQLDAAARKTFNTDMTQWFGLDGRWHSTGEQYRQSKGKRRQQKANRAPAHDLDEAEATTEPVRDGWMFTEAVACRWREYAPVVAEGAEFLAGRTTPSVGGRQIRFDAVEDAMIALIDAQRASPVTANENEPAGRRRRSRRNYSRNFAIAA